MATKCDTYLKHPVSYDRTRKPQNGEFHRFKSFGLNSSSSTFEARLMFKPCCSHQHLPCRARSVLNLLQPMPWPDCLDYTHHLLQDVNQTTKDRTTQAASTAPTRAPTGKERLSTEASSKRNRRIKTRNPICSPPSQSGSL